MDRDSKTVDTDPLDPLGFIKENAPSGALNQGEQKDVSIREDRAAVYYSFEPAESAEYRFVSTGGVKAKGFICEDDNGEIKYVTSSADGGAAADGKNFAINQYLEKGKRYYILSTVADGDFRTGGNFSVKAEIVNDSKLPPHDGAWIVKDNYGSDYWNDGTYYMSYDDASFGYISDEESYVEAVEMQPADKYACNFYYDGSSYERTIEIDSGSKVANIFNAPEDIVERGSLLSAVGFSSWNEGHTEYNIKIYTDLKNMDNPESGKCVADFDASTENPGCHTKELPEGTPPVYLHANSKFAVIVTVKSKTAMGIEESYSEKDEPDSQGRYVDYIAKLDKHQSFAYIDPDNGWQDLYAYDCCARIKAFTKPVTQTWKISKDTRSTFKHDGVLQKTASVSGDIRRTVFPRIAGVSCRNAVFSGKVRRPGIVVKDRTNAVISGKNYNVKYFTKSSKVGKYKLKLTFKGRYEGSKILTYKILPKPTVIRKLTRSRKSFKASWKKERRQTTGYQLRYGVKKSMKGAKSIRIKSNRINSKTIRKLKSNKKYYVQVRTYKKKKGKYYYSKWSKKHAVKAG